ncbi:Rieske (2Fe-2S) protein [Natronobiforma cellulositropha]|uniref:Rieske (2Fe-2S) protein n=1 Tax=Natronobiforma cellulositropha TaxID=1679076 RepID=UPI0021D5F788|nr:Rieske (2Fe-2S) protein [Natronobiforma cellulositropha]
MEPNEPLHYVAETDELEEGGRLITSIRGREIAVFNRENEYYALANYCVHQGGPACEGRLSGRLTEDERGELVYEDDDEFVCCPWHGWEFNIETGRSLAHPDRYRVPTYETAVRDGKLYVRL